MHLTLNLNYKISLIFNTLEICGLDRSTNNFLLSSILDQHGHGFQAKTVHHINAQKNIMTIQLQIHFKTLIFSRKSSMESEKSSEILLTMMFQYCGIKKVKQNL